MFRDIEIPWILVGVIIPDIPWILQRITLATTSFDPYQVRLYVTVQATLLFCTLLCAVLSFFSSHPARLFCLLVVNCVLHLMLDSLQIKWGNGVHLFAPFTWHIISFGIIWPEHILGYCAAVFAMIYLAFNVTTMAREGINITLPALKPSIAAGIGLFLYLILPFFFTQQLEQSNSNYVRTLRYAEQRPGKAVALDRSYYSAENGKVTVFSGESFHLIGTTPAVSGIVSLQGQFTTPYTIMSNRYHMHTSYRNLASYIGLFLSLIIWLYLLYARQHNRKEIWRRT